jgi:hypothetical protein
MADLPARIDRAALDRIIQRAAELQTGERELGDEMTEEQVLALGRDVGIPARYLQQALIEERVRTEPAESRWLDRTIGAATVTADRVVMGRRPQEQVPSRWSAPSMGGPAPPGRVTGADGGFRRPDVGRGAERPMLGKAGSVAATITPLEAGYCHVQLSAELRSTRAAYIGGAAAIVSVGAAATAVLAVLAAFPPILLVPLPVALAAGYAAMRPYAGVAERTRLGLERALDQLQRRGDRPLPPPPPSMITSLVQEVRKALKP